MFTGLIQALGQLKATTPHQVEVLCRDPGFVASIAIGDSVAVDGVCLTVAQKATHGFWADISPETLKRTVLQDRLQADIPVNLELALQVGDRLGGHFVTGHVDGMAIVQDIVKTSEAWELSVTVPEAIAPYIVHKGSVTVNGISLTVAECNGSGTWFKVAIIPHSFGMTNLQWLRPEMAVNLETDVLGKYVAKFLRYPPHSVQSETSYGSSITSDFLVEHGFG